VPSNATGRHRGARSIHDPATAWRAPAQEGIGHCRDEHLCRHWFLNDPKRSQKARRCVGYVVRGQDDDGNVSVDGVDRGEQMAAVHDGHVAIRDDHRGAVPLPRRKASPAISGGGDVEASLGQNVSRDRSPIVVVVDNEHVQPE
jgi:hypothetical protein